MTAIIPLTDAASTDISLVGGKAQGLGRLIAAGFRVPDGFVVTPDVPTSEVATHLTTALNGAGGPLAYRSSAVAEDLADASFAGQYETVLGVEGVEAGVEAIARVRASARGAGVAAYRERVHDGDTRIAVIAQRQISARASGVAFTKNPVTGADEVVIEAVTGIGEALMAGDVTPEEWIVATEPELVNSSGEAVLSRSEVREIADACREAEARLGGPQDIEWAIDDSGLWMLQARPITALPLEPTERPPAKQRWERGDAYFPEPIDTLTYTAWLPSHTEATAQAFAELGLPADRVAHGHYWGRVYDRLIPLGGGASDAGGLPPAPIFKLFIRLVPAFRRRLEVGRRVAAEDVPMRFVSDWTTGGNELLRSRTRELRNVARHQLDDRELADHIAEVRAHTRWAAVEHFRLTLGSWVILGQLGMLVERLLGWEPTRTLELIAGSSDASRREGQAIEALATVVAADPAARALLDHPQAMLDHPGPGGKALRAFLENHGHQAHQSVVRSTWAEDPSPVLSLVQARLARIDSPRPAAADSGAAAAAEALASVEDDEDRRMLERAIQRARTAWPFGDETERDTTECIGLVHYAAMEAARRLAGSGRIGREDDIAHVTIDELEAALRGEALDRSAIARRHAENRWAWANPSPLVVGPDPGPPPGPALFPAETRDSVGAFMWAMGNLMETAVVEHDSEGALRGLGASAGVVTGTARIIRTPAEFDRVQPGDIVVCPSTMASWSPIFAVISGLVTEIGGPLSHPATLAREFSLPAVLGVKEATTLVREGVQIRIDGAAGTVDLLT